MRQKFARWLLGMLGWRIEGQRPDHRKCVLIAAPHTSNWDFPLMLAFAAAFDMKICWMGKHGLFYPPMGWIMAAVGGIPVLRDRGLRLSDAMVAELQARDDLILVVPAEGSRSRGEYWRSGFYHIARQAGVPVVPSYLDFAQKRGGFGPALEVTSDVSADMQKLRSFYAGMEGLYPGQFSPVRLREEDEPGAGHGRGT